LGGHTNENLGAAELAYLLEAGLVVLTVERAQRGKQPLGPPRRRVPVIAENLKAGAHPLRKLARVLFLWLLRLRLHSGARL
jgi:hypothetical protein